MKGKIKVQEMGNGYFSDDMREEGFVGDVEVIGHAAAMVLMKPGASLEYVASSLRLIQKELRLRMEMEDGSKKEKKAD